MRSDCNKPANKKIDVQIKAAHNTHAQARASSGTENGGSVKAKPTLRVALWPAGARTPLRWPEIGTISPAVPPSDN